MCGLPTPIPHFQHAAPAGLKPKFFLPLNPGAGTPGYQYPAPTGLSFPVLSPQSSVLSPQSSVLSPQSSVPPRSGRFECIRYPPIQAFPGFGRLEVNLVMKFRCYPQHEFSRKGSVRFLPSFPAELKIIFYRFTERCFDLIHRFCNRKLTIPKIRQLTIPTFRKIRFPRMA